MARVRIRINRFMPRTIARIPAQIKAEKIRRGKTHPSRRADPK
jgi:hypothetical protein